MELQREEAFPLNLESKVLEPREVGPGWMRGDPRQVPRVGERKPAPDLAKKKPSKEKK